MISVNVKDFVQAVGKISPAINRRAHYTSAYLRFTGSMLQIYTEVTDMYISTEIPATGDDQIDVFCSIIELNKLVKKFKGGGQNLQLFQTETTINFIYNSFEFQLDSIVRVDPTFPKLAFDHIGDMSEREAYTICKLLGPIAPSDMSRPSIQCVYFQCKDNAIAISSADGYRMARVEYQREFPDISLMISQPSIYVLDKIFGKTGFKLSAAGNYVKYSNGGDWVIARNPVDMYTYPDVTRAQSNAYNNAKATLDFYTTDIVKLMKTAVQSHKDSMSCFVVDDNAARVNVMDLESRKVMRDFSDMECDISGENVEVYLNCNYVIDALEGCDLECKMHIGPVSAVFNADYIIGDTFAKYSAVVMGVSVKR